MGVLTVGVVTKPFLFEGTRRMRAAEAGIDELQKHVDTLIVIPNQNLFLVAKAETTFKEAFQLADEVLQQGVRSITDLMVMPGLINLDFADVRSVMSEMGKAMMGTGEGEGENRALDAAEQAIANPLLDGVSMAGAKGVIISIIGGEDMKLLEVDEAANHIRELVDEDANIIWGSAFNPDLKGKIRVSVVATGIEQGAAGTADRGLPTALGGARAPKRPVLELGGEAEQTSGFGTAAAPLAAAAAATPVAPVFADPLPDELDDGEPFDLSGMQADSGFGEDFDDDYEESDDVDGIIDPLAGLRGAGSDAGFSLTAPEPASYGQPADDDTLDLGEAYDDEEEPAAPVRGAGFAPGPQDDLLADADRLASEDRPVEAQLGGARRRGLLGGAAGGGAAGGAAAGAGSTLFERMANLTRSSSSDADDEEDDGDDGDDGDGGPALSIPRFLNRQNNQ
jgi:cell division protein FtsZ